MSELKKKIFKRRDKKEKKKKKKKGHIKEMVKRHYHVVEDK